MQLCVTPMVIVLPPAAATATVPDVQPALAGVTVMDRTQLSLAARAAVQPVAAMIPAGEGLIVRIAGAVPVLEIVTVLGVEVIPTSTVPTSTTAG